MISPTYTASASTLNRIGAVPPESIARAARVSLHDVVEYLAAHAVHLVSAIAIEGALQESGVLSSACEIPCMRGAK